MTQLAIGEYEITAIADHDQFVMSLAFRHFYKSLEKRISEVEDDEKPHLEGLKADIDKIEQKFVREGFDLLWVKKENKA